MASPSQGAVTPERNGGPQDNRPTQQAAERDEPHDARQANGTAQSHPKSTKKKSSRKQSKKLKDTIYRTLMRHKVKRIEEEREKSHGALLPGQPVCRNVRVFVLIYGLIILLRSATSEYFQDAILHMQRRYSIRELDLQFAIGVEKIGFVITLIFAAYYGNKAHKPAVILVGAFLCAVGVVICAVPYFVTGARVARNETLPVYVVAGLCQSGRNHSLDKSQCDILQETDKDEGAFALLCTGKFLSGIGVALFSTLGFVYIAEISQEKDTPLYYGVVLCMNGLGQVLGAALGQWFIHTLPENLSASVMLPDWDVGAWWLGFPVMAVPMALIGLPLLWFPKWIKEPRWSAHRRKRRLAHLHRRIEEEENNIRRRRRKRRRRERRRKRKEQREAAAAAREAEQDEQGSAEVQDGARASVHVVVGQDNRAFNNDANVSVNSHPTSRPHSSRGDAYNSDGEEDPEVEEEVNEVEQEDGDDDDDDEEEEDEEGEEEGEEKQKQEADEAEAVDRVVATGSKSLPPESEVHEEPSTKKKSRTRTVQFAEEITQISSEIPGDFQEFPGELGLDGPQMPGEDDDASVTSDGKGDKIKRRHYVGRRLEDLPRNLWFLLRVPMFTLLALATSLAAYLDVGYAFWQPQYLLTQFHQSSPPPFIVSGVSRGFAVAIGAFFGGLVIYRYRLSSLQQVRLVLGALATCTVLLLVLIVFQCPQTYFGLEGGKIEVEPAQRCNRECDCVGVDLIRVCSHNGTMFPSPCHAGCTRVRYDESTQQLVYSGCTCSPADELSSQWCHRSCAAPIPYVIIAFLAVAVQSTAQVTVLWIFLRVTSSKLRSLSLGFALWIITLLAYVPGAAVFKALHGASCLYYKESCYYEHVCWYSDLDLLRYLQNGVAAAFQAASLVCFCVVWYRLHRSQRAKIGGVETAIEDGQSSHSNPVPSTAELPSDGNGEHQSPATGQHNPAFEADSKQASVVSPSAFSDSMFY